MGKLFKRNQRTLVGAAPIRENLAAAFSYFTQTQTSSSLCDPMCGSGTLLLEANSFYQKSLDPNLAFRSLPLFLKQRHQAIVGPNFLKTFAGKTWGFDICDQTLRAAQKNAPQTHFQKNDLWEFWPPKSGLKQRFDHIIVNPPWNKRISLDRSHKKNYHQLFQVLTSSKPSFLAMILPRDVSVDHFSISPTKKLFLKSGGLSIQFVHWELSSLDGSQPSS